MDLPPEIRQMIYKYVFANRTIHVHYPIRIETRPGEEFPIDWTYFICNCNSDTSVERSTETADCS